MARIVTPNGSFESFSPESEKEFEDAVVENSNHIFGAGRYYVDCKRRIGAKGGKFNIPDGYLIDLHRKDPSLFVVENELARHDLFKHIGVQLLEFSFTYRQAGRQVRGVLFEEISKVPEILKGCES